MGMMGLGMGEEVVVRRILFSEIPFAYFPFCILQRQMDKFLQDVLVYTGLVGFI